jgi:hypothetical protein
VRPQKNAVRNLLVRLASEKLHRQQTRTRRREKQIRERAERRPMRAEARARLLAAIAKARRWLDGLIAGSVRSFV